MPVTCVWSTRSAGLNTLVVWQLSHRFDVVMCVVFLPVACVPLWQAEQPLTMPAWSKVLAGSQAVVAWQIWQSLCEGMWLADLPVACVPLWQETQLP